MKTITINVSNEFHEKFAEAAKSEGMLRDAFARAILEREVETILKKSKK